MEIEKKRKLLDFSFLIEILVKRSGDSVIRGIDTMLHIIVSCFFVLYSR